MPSAAETRLFWDQHADAWSRRAAVISRHLAVYGHRGIEALDLQTGEHVLDVGCGPGYCAQDLADRVGDSGQVHGVDIAPEMIAVAQRTAAAGRANVSFRVADAQTAALGREAFDAAYARFSLLFADQVAGLSNIRRALRPGGRFGCLVWGPRQDNPWMHVPQLAASRVLGIEPPSIRSALDRSAAADELAGSLSEAGFVNVAVEVRRGARHLAQATVEEDISILFEEGGGHSATWARAGAATRGACCQAAIAEMAPYRTPGGWTLPGCALLGIGAVPS